jgi:putative sterol carrier protein
MPDELTISRLMELMPKAFLPEKAQGVEAVIQFSFSGEEAGDWTVTIADGACSVTPGTSDDPKLTLSSDSGVYLDILTGKLNAMSAFAEGKIKLKGDLGLAMKLMNFFKLPA